MEAILAECVRSSLRGFMHRNAVFMCERLCAEFPSEVNLQLLAGCYLHNNQAYCAYHVLKGTQMPQSRYLFAISCFQMDLLKEAEAALCNANEPGAEAPNGAAGHYLLGLIYRYTDRKRGAVHHFKQALSIDPLLWSAYEELCALDEGKFRKISGRLFSDSGPRRSTRLAGDAGANAGTNATSVSGNGTSNSSKYLGSSKLSSVALRAVTVRKGQSWANENSDEGVRNEVSDDSRSSSTSGNCFCPSGDNRSLDQEGASMSVAGSVLTSTRVLTGTKEVLGLLRLFGEAYRLSCLYRWQDALDVYSRLTHKHYNTGWVLSQVGKAYFELVDYMEADRAFNLARRTTPYSLEGMDIYSTVLYHLKEDMKLSYLAQELIATDRLAPQAWCAMGNCFGLQNDHETALKNFQRAVQLDSKFAYAHTLCGHEFVSLEDYENGIQSYQTALRIDARHYNAWYGLGMVYLRQEKFEFSEHHFRMAFNINPCSSVIMSYLGTALHASKRSEEALMIMEKAILADRKNPLPVYQKANILMSLEKLDEALEVLEELKEYAPRESSVYALMGKIYKSRNMHSQAMLHFGLALDLKPSATDVATLKAAIEKLHVPDEIEDCL
ncbi:hypothetical protein EUGRSUZ_D00685 [Eucalyptus grandis]|uniref:Cdc23 domain-containing protein n=1 Tax=Eucalyptus grandis TaxID=71139 RepID=A0A059CDQ3_EUCGR|nr:hypothetical protein EUGRSUZ_D00685 [Eucalyptus grandis]